jgi:hypothetical protein
MIDNVKPDKTHRYIDYLENGYFCRNTFRHIRTLFKSLDSMNKARSLSAYGIGGYKTKKIIKSVKDDY